MSLLVKDATVVTNDPKRTAYAPGAVFVEGRRIADVGPSDALAARHAGADRLIDGAGKIVIPGMISLHTHAGWTVFRGLAEDRNFRDVVVGTYNPMNALMLPDERRRLGSYTYLELLRGGVTTVVEMEEDVEALAPFVESMGMRSAMGLMAFDVPAERLLDGSFRADAALAKEQNERAVRFAEEWHGAGDGRITALIAPRGVANSSADQLRSLRKAADRLGRRIAIHLGWGRIESEVTEKLYGKKAFRHAYDLGMLGADVIATHCYMADDDDLDLLVRTKTHIGHCPVVNAMRGHIAPVADLRARGLNVGLGTDNYFADFFEVMRQAVTVARVRGKDATAFVSGDAFEMATMGAARALGMEDELGSLEKGKRADIAIVDARRAGLAPVNDPVANLVWHANMHHVSTVIVDGKILLDGGRFTTVDESEIVAAAEEANRAAWSRFVARYGSTLATAPAAS